MNFTNDSLHLSFQFPESQQNNSDALYQNQHNELIEQEDKYKDVYVKIYSLKEVIDKKFTKIMSYFQQSHQINNQNINDKRKSYNKYVYNMKQVTILNEKLNSFYEILNELNKNLQQSNMNFILFKSIRQFMKRKYFYEILLYFKNTVYLILCKFIQVLGLRNIQTLRNQQNYEEIKLQFQDFDFFKEEFVFMLNELQLGVYKIKRLLQSNPFLHTLHINLQGMCIRESVINQCLKLMGKVELRQVKQLQVNLKNCQMEEYIFNKLQNFLVYFSGIIKLNINMDENPNQQLNLVTLLFQNPQIEDLSISKSMNISSKIIKKIPKFMHNSQIIDDNNFESFGPQSDRIKSPNFRNSLYDKLNFQDTLALNIVEDDKKYISIPTQNDIFHFQQQYLHSKTNQKINQTNYSQENFQLLHKTDHELVESKLLDQSSQNQIDFYQQTNQSTFINSIQQIKISEKISLQYLTLNLQRNSISNKGVQSIMFQLNHLQIQLQSLQLILHDNMISDQGIIFIFDQIINYKELKVLKLDLGKNLITNQGVHQASLILDNSNQFLLKNFKLYLDRNPIETQGLSQLMFILTKKIDIFRNNFEIKLNFSHILIDSLFIKLMCEFIRSSSQSIMSISLGLNQTNLRDQDLQQILIQLDQCSKLTYVNLDLQNNNLKNKKISLKHVQDQYINI